MAGELVVGHQVIERAILGDKLKSLLQRRRTQDRECAADQLRFEDLEPQTLAGRLHFDYDATEEPRAQVF